MEKNERIQGILEEIVEEVNDFVNAKLEEHNAGDYKFKSFEVRHIETPVQMNDILEIGNTSILSVNDLNEIQKNRVNNDPCYVCIGPICIWIC